MNLYVFCIIVFWLYISCQLNKGYAQINHDLEPTNIDDILEIKIDQTHLTDFLSNNYYSKANYNLKLPLDFQALIISKIIINSEFSKSEGAEFSQRLLKIAK